ncbi:MAG: hypothetical protein HZA77_05340 [Candidatus Schekmanbacteria bacterium]|nr:hypothetical protein [Candidatus Schekmanbacteria bacterium]
MKLQNIFFVIIIILVGTLPLCFVANSNEFDTAVSVLFSSYKIGFAVDADNKIWKTDDAGKTWHVVYNPIGNDLDIVINNFYIGNQGRIYAIGTGILKTDDGGKTWEKIGIQKQINLKNLFSIGIINLNSMELVYASVSNNIYVSSNNGDTWNSIRWQKNNENVSILYGGNSYLVAGTDKGFIYKSLDKGITWKKVGMNISEGQIVNGKKIVNAPPDCWVIHTLKIFPSGVGYTINYVGGVSKTEDNGLTWKIVRHPNPKDETLHRSALISDQNRIFIPGEGGDLLYTHDGGKSWQKAVITNLDGSKSEKDFWSVSMVDVNIGWLISFDGLLYKTVDGGKTWKQQEYKVIKK